MPDAYMTLCPWGLLPTSGRVRPAARCGRTALFGRTLIRLTDFGVDSMSDIFARHSVTVDKIFSRNALTQPKFFRKDRSDAVVHKKSNVLVSNSHSVCETLMHAKACKQIMNSACTLTCVSIDSKALASNRQDPERAKALHVSNGPSCVRLTQYGPHSLLMVSSLATRKTRVKDDFTDIMSMSDAIRRDCSNARHHRRAVAIRVHGQVIASSSCRTHYTAVVDNFSSTIAILVNIVSAE